MQDVTEQRETEAALRHREKQLRLALLAAQMEIGAWDAAADAHHRDANLNGLFGLDCEETIDPSPSFSHTSTPATEKRSASHSTTACETAVRIISSSGLFVLGPERLSLDIEPAICRTMQEALNNAGKHARATESTVAVM